MLELAEEPEELDDEPLFEPELVEPELLVEPVEPELVEVEPELVEPELVEPELVEPELVEPELDPVLEGRVPGLVEIVPDVEGVPLVLDTVPVPGVLEAVEPALVVPVVVGVGAFVVELVDGCAVDAGVVEVSEE